MKNEPTTKVLICDEFGGFSLSHAAFLRLRELGSEIALKEPNYGERWNDGSGPREQSVLSDSFCRDIPRDDPLVLQVFEELGQAAAGMCCHLAVVEIPDDAQWHIEEYDGNEHVAEDHRTWP